MTFTLFCLYFGPIAIAYQLELRNQRRERELIARRIELRRRPLPLMTALQ